MGSAQCKRPAPTSPRAVRVVASVSVELRKSMENKRLFECGLLSARIDSKGNHITPKAGARVVLHPSETDIQITVIAWCKLRKDEARHAFHISNESKRTRVGHAIQAKMGKRAGAADLFIPGARGGWHGLFLELKKSGETPKPKQLEFARDMGEDGYLATWADSVDEALRIIGDYMAGKYIRPNWVHYDAPAKGVGP